MPAMVRWPGRIAPGTVSNEIVSHLDWLPTFLAAAGEPDIKSKLLQATRPATSASGCTWTATTCCPI